MHLITPLSNNFRRFISRFVNKKSILYNIETTKNHVREIRMQDPLRFEFKILVSTMQNMVKRTYDFAQCPSYRPL